MTKQGSEKLIVDDESRHQRREVFTCDDPERIARMLKASVEKSPMRKSGPFRSAMATLCFYINRAGKNITKEQRRVLEQSKEELRKLFDK